IAEQAGGSACDGFKRIMDVEPRELHQRTPLYIGSRAEVETVNDFPLENMVAPGMPERRGVRSTDNLSAPTLAQ
ncbi:MAG: hypothetical protein ABIW79_09440, partial [Gemmatimonas sp.]